MAKIKLVKGKTAVTKRNVGKLVRDALLVTNTLLSIILVLLYYKII